MQKEFALVLRLENVIQRLNPGFALLTDERTKSQIREALLCTSAYRSEGGSARTEQVDARLRKTMLCTNLDAMHETAYVMTDCVTPQAPQSVAKGRPSAPFEVLRLSRFDCLVASATIPATLHVHRARIACASFLAIKRATSTK